MEQQPKIGIKIEGPTEEQLPVFFTVILSVSLIFVLLTLALLVAEFLNLPLPALPTLWQ